MLHAPPHRPALQALLRQHRGSLVAAAAVLLAGFGITAIAVAPLAPDAADLPRRTISEAITPPDLSQQLEALAAHSFTLTRSDITRGTDTPETLLARLGVRDAQAAAFLRSDPAARQLLAGRGGRLVQVQTTVDGFLEELVARWPSEAPELARTHFTRLTVARAPDGRWAAQAATAAYGTEQRLASGTISATLFAATDEAGIPDSVAAQIADIFSTDIDFHRELRRGDTFSVVYEALTADGQPVPWNEGAGRVLAAEFVNAGRVHHAVWFTTAAACAGASWPAPWSSRASPRASRCASTPCCARAARTWAWTTARPWARRCARWPTASSSSRAGRTATARSSRSTTATARPRSTPT